MDPLLLSTASAFGLASAAGLNTTLPLLLVGLAARLGLLMLAAPYDALASNVALVGLGFVAILELVGDKVPALDSVVQAVQWPITLAAGAILFGSQQSIVSDVSPGLAIVVGLLTAGSFHAVRSAARPVVNLATLGFGAPFASALEDTTAVTLSLAALFAPLVALALLAAAVTLAAWLIISRRRVPARA